MSRKYKFHTPDGVYSVTFAVQGWVNVFSRTKYKNILADNLALCMQKKARDFYLPGMNVSTNQFFKWHFRLVRRF